MSEHTVPLDIIENIIDILINDYDGLECIKAFSLTCRAILPLCRTHMFSFIRIFINADTRIDVKEMAHSSTAFEQLLLETPEIATYILQLEITLNGTMSESTHFFDHVPQLTRLQSLDLNCFDFESLWSPTHWNDIPSSIQRTLLIFIHLPTLTHLTLGWIQDFPISNLTPCNNLKRLSAKELCLTSKHDLVSSPSYKPIQLQALDINLASLSVDVRSSRGWLALDLTWLEKICVELSEQHDTFLIREIIRKSLQLRDISLTGIFNIPFTGPVPITLLFCSSRNQFPRPGVG